MRHPPKGGEGLFKKAAGGAVNALEEQLSRAQTSNRQAKLAGRLATAEKTLEQQTEKAGAIIHTVVSDTATKVHENANKKSPGKQKE